MIVNLTLVVTKGNETRRFPIRGDGPCVVGRGQDVDIQVADVSISRQQFTLRHAGDAVDLVVSPQSRNQVLLNGHPVTSCQVRPGDRLSVGYCSFEILAEAELPKVKAPVVPGDPAGPIDLSLAEEARRIAPRWLASIEDAEAARLKAEAAKANVVSRKKTTVERLALPGALVVLLGLLFVIYQRDSGPAILEAPQRLDLFADPPPVECNEADECFERARRAYELGLKLAEQSGADPGTVYKAARQFQSASIALKGQLYRLPELQPRYETARRKVITSFEDARLRLIRAQQEGNPAAALAAIDEQLAMLQESKHPYRDRLLRARVKVKEVKEQARKDALLGGGR